MIESDILKDNHFKGNPNLKSPGEKITWTQQMVEEYIKCSQDPIYFIKKYMRIINADEGLIPFDMYDYQEEIVTSIKDNRYTIVCASRQCGKSLTVCGFALWYILFNSDKTVAILANKAETAKEILGKIRVAYQHIPKWLQQGVTVWNKMSICLENNSKIISSATSSAAIRGFVVNVLILDEVAFIENYEEFFTSVYPTISSGKTTKVVMISTPNGMNHFYETWKGAEEKTNGYNPIRVSWERVPGRDEEWKQETLAGLNYDQQKFNQEFVTEFAGSSGTLISGWKLMQLKHQEPINENHFGLKQYVLPEKEHSYICIVDTSRGKGLDYSAFSIIDTTALPYIQVCTFRNNEITPIEYTEIVYNMCVQYNNAYILVESNDVGSQVADLIHHQFEYENQIYTEAKGSLGRSVSYGFSPSTTRGIRTTRPVKNLGCSILKLLIEQDKLIAHDKQTIQEMMTFSAKNQSWEAEQGCHDDMIMGLVLFAWLTTQSYFADLNDINTVSNLRERSSQEIMDEILPFFINVEPEEIETAKDIRYMIFG